MRLTTVATIGVLPFDGQSQASATRGMRVAVHHEKTALRHAAAGAAERGSDAAAEGQSAPVMAGLFWHSTQPLAAYAPTYTTHHITTEPPGSRDENSDYVRPSIRNSPHRHFPSRSPRTKYRSRMSRHTQFVMLRLTGWRHPQCTQRRDILMRFTV